MRRSTGRAGAVGMWAWVDDLTPLVARSRFRRYTYTRSPMRDDPGDRLVLVVQERVTLETSAVVRCAGPEWLLARAASRGACRERESRWSRRCPDPNRSRARKPSRRAATHSRNRPVEQRQREVPCARSVTAPRPDAIERIPNLTLTLTLNEVRKAPRPELLERIKTHSALQRCVHQSAQRDLHHSLRHEADRKVVHAR